VPTTSISAPAIRRGLAPDGGLYVPDRLPTIALDAWPDTTGLRDVGRVLLEPFFAGDALQSELGGCSTMRSRSRRRSST
jgi:threonine synthase